MEQYIVPEIEVDVVHLDSDTIDEHLRASTSVLTDILKDDTSNGHECQNCNKLYKTASALQKHSQLKHPIDKIEVQCLSCDKKYPSIMSLQKHVRYMHTYEHRCRACYRTFATAKVLEDHGKLCSKTASPCPDCGKTYVSQIALRNHVKYKHPQEKSNWCGICRRAFITSRGLANHISAIHPRGTSCTWCDKDFNSLVALQSHVLYKHTENAARCNECRKVFLSQASLERHKRKSHGAKSNYICGACNSTFNTCNELFYHVMNTHAGQSTKK